MHDQDNQPAGCLVDSSRMTLSATQPRLFYITTLSCILKMFLLLDIIEYLCSGVLGYVYFLGKYHTYYSTTRALDVAKVKLWEPGLVPKAVLVNGSEVY